MTRFTLILIVATLHSACVKPQLVQQRQELILSHMRSIAAAEAVYSSINAGAYGPLECLQSPASCLPGYPPSGALFLPSGIPSAAQAGFSERFHPGPVMSGGGLARSSMTDWAYTAIPKDRQSGKTAFCIDNTGRICALSDSKNPAVVDGRCPSGCRAIQ